MTHTRLLPVALGMGVALGAGWERAGESTTRTAVPVPVAAKPVVLEAIHPSVEKMLEQIDQRSEQIKDLEAELVRTKISYAWGDKVQRKGVLKYRRPDLWYVDLGTGKQREIWVGTGKAVYQVKFRLQQVVEHEVHEDQRRSALEHGPISFLLGQKANETRKRYRLELVKDDDKATTLRAIPRPGLRVGFTKAELTVEKQTALPMRVHMWERTRDQLIFEFRNVRENKGLAVSQFHKPKVPSGWTFLKRPLPRQDKPQPPKPPSPDQPAPWRR